MYSIKMEINFEICLRLHLEPLLNFKWALDDVMVIEM